MDEYARAGALEVAGLPGGDRPGRPGGGGSLPAPAPRRAAAAARELRLVRLDLAVALLGLEAMSDVVRRAFERGLIDPMVTDYDLFRRISGGRWPTPSGWRASGTTTSRRWRTRSGSCPAGTPSRTRPSGTGRGRSRARSRPSTAAAGAGRQPVQARRPQRSLPVRQREEVQEVLPAPGVGPVGRRLAVSASTLTCRDPATTVTVILRQRAAAGRAPQPPTAARPPLLRPRPAGPCGPPRRRPRRSRPRPPAAPAGAWR